MGLLVWSPLAGGYLSGKYTDADPTGGGGRLATRKSFSVPADRSNVRDAWAPIMDGVRKVAAARGVAPATVAIAWLLERPAVSTVLIGATKAEQLAQNLEAGALNLTPEEVAELEAVSRPEPRYPQTFLGRVYEDQAYHVLGRLPEYYPTR